jgi:hypothetical protein
MKGLVTLESALWKISIPAFSDPESSFSCHPDFFRSSTFFSILIFCVWHPPFREMSQDKPSIWPTIGSFKQADEENKKLLRYFDLT